MHLVGEPPELLSPLVLGPLRAERAHVESSSLDARPQGRDVEALLVDERDDCGVGVDLDLVGPGQDELVGTGNALARREPGTRVDDDRAPAERLRERAERLRDVARADGDEPGWGSHHLRKHRAALLLAQLGTRRRLVLPAPAHTVSRDDHVARAALERRGACERLDEHVDLAAARQADAPGLVVGDAVRDELRRGPCNHGLGALRDVGFDATPRHRAEHAAARGDGQLRAEGPRRAAPGRDDRRDRHVLTCTAPLLCLREHFVHSRDDASHG